MAEAQDRLRKAGAESSRYAGIPISAVHPQPGSARGVRLITTRLIQSVKRFATGPSS